MSDDSKLIGPTSEPNDPSPPYVIQRPALTQGPDDTAYFDHGAIHKPYEEWWVDLDKATPYPKRVKAQLAVELVRRTSDSGRSLLVISLAKARDNEARSIEERGL